MEALAEYGEVIGEPHNEQSISLNEARRMVELAKKEVDSHFPLLHSQTLIFIWSSLEEVIRSFLVAHLFNDPSAKNAVRLKKLKINLGEYESRNEEEKCYYILELLERELDAPFKLGISRFEALLDVFGFSGKVYKYIKNNIFELQQIRHNLAHNRGIADRILIERCPWLHLQVGQPVVVTHRMIRKYHRSTMRYIGQVVNRVIKIYNAR